MICYLLRQIQKEQDKHFSSARAPTPWWVQPYNNLQVRELHPHFKLALVISQRCLPNEMTAIVIIIMFKSFYPLAGRASSCPLIFERS